jgi:hypothetical protein
MVSKMGWRKSSGFLRISHFIRLCVLSMMIAAWVLGIPVKSLPDAFADDVKRWKWKSGCQNRARGLKIGYNDEFSRG